ncbi:MAG: hypothetical protein LOY01_15710, partial [Brachybacterium paraconglomeratum]|nr:hypothetical protein [Brachybacterium paraconglomeratum]
KGSMEAVMAMEGSMMRAMGRDVEKARYARGTSHQAGRGVDEVRADVEECTVALRAGATPRRRRWATLLPRSLARNDALTSLLRRPGTATGPVATGVDRAV